LGVPVTVVVMCVIVLVRSLFVLVGVIRWFTTSVVGIVVG
jgi:hypothetical protein